MQCGHESSFNPPSGFVLFRSLFRNDLENNGKLVSIRQADLCCFEDRTRQTSSHTLAKVSIRQADLCCFEGNSRVSIVKSLCFNPPSGFVLFRSANHLWFAATTLVSIRQADLCCFEVACLCEKWIFGKNVSIRQADLCCFEEPSWIKAYPIVNGFQSAKRICAVSKTDVAAGRIYQISVSIRQADLCCFEAPIACRAWLAMQCCFNPPSGFVLFRRQLRSSELNDVQWFQSAKRICAVSKFDPYSVTA